MGERGGFREFGTVANFSTPRYLTQYFHVALHSILYNVPLANLNNGQMF